MNGVMTPGVSAGSYQVGARETGTDTVIVPAGAADAGTVCVTARASAAIRSTNERGRVIGPPLCCRFHGRIGAPVYPLAAPCVGCGILTRSSRCPTLGRKPPAVSNDGNRQ